MAQSLSRIILHIVFSTNKRTSLLSHDVRLQLHAYLATIIRNMNAHAYRVGGTADHVHIACTLPRIISQSDFLKKIKITSSKWLKEQGIIGFSWQNGYGAFSIGQSQLPQLLQYIDNQEVHHRKMKFQEEYRELLAKYEIEDNESYVWN